MSKIYALIENQVNNILRILLVDDYTGEIKYGSFIPGPKWVAPVVSILTSLLFLFVVLTFGVFLWNKGLHPLFPNVVAVIDGKNPNQANTEWVQLVLTLFALMLFL